MKDNRTISDEQLAAFLDGNASAEEIMGILRMTEHDPELREILRIAGEVDEDLVELRTPLPMTAMAAKNKDNYLCDIECEEYVLHQFGFEATHKTLLDTAYRNRWLQDKGMPLYNIGRLLEKNHLSVSRRYDSTISEIDRLLTAGNQLIAVVDDTLLCSPAHSETQQPDHAVVVCNLQSDVITLYNPNTEEEYTDYPVQVFERAWQRSNHYLVVVNTTDQFVYEPTPIELDEIELTDELLELREAIAENAHEVWAKARTDQGWRYGPTRNDERKETPDLVPYCNLPEGEKQYDRDMAMQTLKLVSRLGFEIVRR